MMVFLSPTLPSQAAVRQGRLALPTRSADPTGTVRLTAVRHDPPGRLRREPGSFALASGTAGGIARKRKGDRREATIMERVIRHQRVDGHRVSVVELLDDEGPAYLLVVDDDMVLNEGDPLPTAPDTVAVSDLYRRWRQRT